MGRLAAFLAVATVAIFSLSSSAYAQRFLPGMRGFRSASHRFMPSPRFHIGQVMHRSTLTPRMVSRTWSGRASGNHSGPRAAVPRAPAGVPVTPAPTRYYTGPQTVGFSGPQTVGGSQPATACNISSGLYCRLPKPASPGLGCSCPLPDGKTAKGTTG
jgi:hypothetical protein